MLEVYLSYQKKIEVQNKLEEITSGIMFTTSEKIIEGIGKKIIIETVKDPVLKPVWIKAIQDMLEKIKVEKAIIRRRAFDERNISKLNDVLVRVLEQLTDGTN